MSNNIYLHFLDRELRESVGAVLNEYEIYSAIFSAICLTPGQIYCSYSHLWESYDLIKNIFDLLKDIIISTTRHFAPDEFIESRKTLYLHDRERYPLYFNKKFQKIILNTNPRNTLNSSTTEYIEECLVDDIKNNFDIKLGRQLLLTLKNRNNAAITKSLFSGLLSQNSYAYSQLRVKISQLYTRHYLFSCKATIITGINKLNFYDKLADDIYTYNHPIFMYILSNLFNFSSSPRGYEQAIKEVLNLILLPRHGEFLKYYEIFIQLIKSIQIRDGRVYSIRGVLNLLAPVIQMIRITKKNSFDFQHLNLYLPKIIQNLSKKYNVDIQNSQRKYILLILTTDNEFSTFFKVADLRRFNPARINPLGNNYWNIGTSNQYNLVLVRTEMGSIGPNSSLLAINDAINKFNPSYIIMCGIAFGLNPKKQKLTDLIISENIVDYETSKLTELNIEHRGLTYQANSTLLEAAKIQACGDANIHFGTILSGSKVVNDSSFVDKLKQDYPEAIGGEMEGIGLASSCQRHNVPWILIKGICDWGMKKSDDCQLDAAHKSIRFCFDLINQL